MEKHTVVAVDIAKSKFQVAVSEAPGRVSRERRLDRPEVAAFFAQQPAAVVVMEACGSAHHWARVIADLGHEVILLPPHQVRPYVTRNKTDRADAKGILEASVVERLRSIPGVGLMTATALVARADSIMARGRDAPTVRGRRYVCSPIPVTTSTSGLPLREVPRRYGRVKARPPSAVRSAQP